MFRRGFTGDLLLNYLAFAWAALGGLLFLFICAHYLGMAGLGVVSQAMALFVIAGQLAAGGVQLSALQVAADPLVPDLERRQRLWAAQVAALAWGTLVAVAGFLAADTVAWLADSPQLGRAWQVTAPALALFAANKAAASALAGLERLRRFAAQMALRALLVAAFALLFAAGGADAVGVCAAFLCSEVLLYAFLLHQLRVVAGRPDAPQRAHVADHLRFGFRGMWSGLAYEINLRVDVLLVGVYLQDAAVGLYALVAQLAEGFFNLLIVLRNQLNPVLARALAPKDPEALLGLSRGMVRFVVPCAGIAAVIGVYLYAPVVGWALPAQGYGAGTALLAILLAGLVANAWIMPLESILVLAKKPGSYSWLMLLVVVTNVTLNLLLIPWLGLIGAAMATAISSVLSGIYLLFVVRGQLGFWLLPVAHQSARVAPSRLPEAHS